MKRKAPIRIAGGTVYADVEQLVTHKLEVARCHVCAAIECLRAADVTAASDSPQRDAMRDAARYLRRALEDLS